MQNQIEGKTTKGVLKSLPLKDIIEWDVENWSKALPFWERFLPRPGPHLKILTLGERNGGLALWLALKGYNVIYSDRVPPKQTAINLHEAYKVSDKVTYLEIDVYNIPFDDNTFDVILCKSMIGGLKLSYHDKKTRTLDNQKIACEEIKRVLKPGGIFLGAENMRGSFLHQRLRAIKGKLKEWRYLSCSDVRYIFSNFYTVDLKCYGFLGTKHPSNLINKISGGLNSLLSGLLPPGYLYISFIAARK